VLVAAITPLAGLAFARALGLTGLIGAPPGPVAPAVLPPQLAGIVAVALVLALVRLAAHPALVRALGPGRGDPGAPGAALAVVGVLCAVTVLIWVRNPYAAVLLVPAVHLWLFTLSPDLRPRRGAGLALVALGVVPLVLLALAEMVAFGLGPADAVWFALLLVAGGHTGPLAWVLWSVVAGCVACAVVVAWRGRAAVPPSRAGGAGSAVRDVRSVRGPASYAGPGSLGGVESGLPR
jgi:hypothetical protein